MATLQVGKDVFGLARQGALGTPATAPQFAHGLAGGGIKVGVTQEVDPLTSAHVSPAGAFRDEVNSGAEITARAWTESVGLYLLGALGDIDSSGGAPAVPAVLTTALTGVNNDLTFLAVTPGTAGNSITVKLTDPAGNDQELSVSVVSNDIEVSLATGGAGAITSTARQVRNALNADTNAKAKITTSVAPGNTGYGIVTILAKTNLAGGAAAGGGSPYTHVITLGETIPYLTAFELKGDNTKPVVRDCKVDELGLAWDGNKPVELTAKLVGTVLSFGTTFEALVDELDTVTYFRPAGGSFKLDVDSDTPVTAALVAGSISIKRAAEPQFYSGDIEAGDVAEGFCTVECSFTVVPADLAEWRTVITGTANGAAVAGDPVYGSFEMAFVKGADTLTLAADKVAFMCDLPDADPAGGAAKVELAAIAYREGTTPLTAVLVNTHADYDVEV